MKQLYTKADHYLIFDENNRSQTLPVYWPINNLYQLESKTFSLVHIANTLCSCAIVWKFDWKKIFNLLAISVHARVTWYWNKINVTQPKCMFLWLLFTYLSNFNPFFFGIIIFIFRRCDRPVFDYNFVSFERN